MILRVMVCSFALLVVGCKTATDVDDRYTRCARDPRREECCTIAEGCQLVDPESLPGIGRGRGL